MLQVSASLASCLICASGFQEGAYDIDMLSA